MLQSLMVYSNANDFYSITSPILDENVAKHLMNAEPIESYIINAAAAVSSPPLQDYLFAPTSNNSMASAPFPSLQHQNQRQHSQYPIATSAPSSPPYPVIKSEEVARPASSMDYLVYNPAFDISPSSSPSQQPHILPSQQSPPMGPQRTMPFQDLSLMQQHHHHHQQQAQHAQQLRLQHQQRQMMYESTTASSTMSIPATTSIMTTMTTPSGSLMAPCSTVTTSVPFINATTLAQDTTQPQYTFQTTYAPAAHPAAPRHKREESAHSLPRQSPPPAMMASSPSPLLAASAIPSTSSRLDKIKSSRSTRITKSGSTSSASSTTSVKKAARSSDSRESSLQPEGSPIAAAATPTAITSAIMTSAQTLLQPATALSSSSSSASRAQNVTHPRRAAQNRAAQRTFRNRRKAYIKELEQRVQEVDQTRDMLESIHQENQEVWRRLQILESLASQNGLVLPAFPALTPIALSMELTKRVTLEESEQ